LWSEDRPLVGQFFTGTGGSSQMVASVAIAMFVALVGWGGKYFGWNDPDGKVQLALITAFILGIIGGFKARS
jgi:uncharacterized membrane protein YjjB (DUF3815 family)